MTASRLWTAGAALVIAAILGLGWLLGVAPLLAQASTADTERASVEAQNLAQRATLETMRADFDRLDEIREELDGLRSSVPAEEATDLFAIAVEQAALAHGVFVTSIVASEMPFLGAQGDAAIASPGVGGVAMTTAAGAVYAIPVTIVFEGEETALLATLRDLQALSRLFIVNNVTATIDIAAPAIPTATVSGYIFLLTDRSLAPTPEDAAVAPPAPRPTPTPQPTPSETPAP